MPRGIFRSYVFLNLKIFAGLLSTLEFLDSGCKVWMQDSGLWMLNSGRWNLCTGYCCWLVQDRISFWFWLSYWKFFEWESLRNSWPRSFCRGYRFWCGYFQKSCINVNSYVIKEYWKKFLLWEIELHYKRAV